MKILKRKGYEETTIRRICTDDKKKVVAIIGTVGDMLKANLLTYCDYSPETWLLLPVKQQYMKPYFAATREQLIDAIQQAGY